MVSNLVAAEACYINTANPDFIGGHGAMQKAQEKLGINTNPQQQQQQQQASQSGSKSLSSTHNPVSPIPPTRPPSSHPNAEDSAGIFGGFFSKKPAANRRPGILEAPPAVLKASGAITEREFLEMEVIKALLHSYYEIVKRTLVDMVPKSIMLQLVNYSREELQRGLLGELYREELAEELLRENEEVVARRAEIRKMIKALQKADEIVSGV